MLGTTENTTIAPALTAAAGSIRDNTMKLNQGYKDMERLAANMVSAIKTNFEHGTITTNDLEGNETLREIINGWEHRFNEVKLDFESNTKVDHASRPTG
jgi:hypothetical protein